MTRVALPASSAIVVSLLGSVACGPLPVPGASEPGPDVVIAVENGHFDAVWVALEQAGTRIPLGRVDGLSVRRFRLRSAGLGAATRVALVAGVRTPHPAPVTTVLELEPGLRARWVLTQGLRHASLIR